MWVLQGETGREQVALVEIEDGAVEQLQAARIDEHLGAVRSFEHFVVPFRRLIKGERVGKTRTAARLDGDAKATPGLALLAQLLLDHARRAVCNLNHVSA